MPEPTPKGKKLPKNFWIIGIAAAVIIGLYLRSRSQSQAQPASSSQSGSATDVTSNPYYYTASGAYADPYATGNMSPYDPYAASPYGLNSLLGSSGLPSGFDPTSFEEGISYAQQSLGTSTTTDLSSGAPTPVGASGASSPGTITLNIGTSPAMPGKPKQSAKPTTHPKPPPKKKVKAKR